MEMNCKWYFGPEGGVDNGPTNPSKGTFRSLPDINIVREAIQNSLDVPAGSDPVEVSFSFSRLKSSDFPNFFKIREHIRASLDYYKHTDRAKEKFPEMIKYLSKCDDIDHPGEPVDAIDVLTISDSKTTGMKYIKDNRECSFYAFFHSVGVSVCKGESSGGSNGLGKETLYNRSKIKTLLLSTKNSDAEVVFQGACKLTTHKDPDTGEKVTAFGYYGQNKDEPVTDVNAIPECFRRNGVGTDIHIVGIDLTDHDGVRNSIVEAVLNHFWLAVHREKLIVDVDGVKINKATLSELIAQYFTDNRETQTDRYEKWNPRPYYNAVLHVDAKKEKSAYEEADLPVLGHVRIYLDWSGDDLPKRIAYMRQPRMVIYKKARRAFPSFVAVFVCDNEVGNRVLRCVEPPAHDEWAVEFYEGPDKVKHKQGIMEVERFVNEALDKYLKPKSSHNEIIIPGIAEMLPDTDEQSVGGERGTVGSGASEGLQPSGKIAQNETAAPSSFILNDTGETHLPDNKPKSTGTVNSLVEDTAPAKDEGDPADVLGATENNTDGGSGGGGGQDDTRGQSATVTAEKKGARAHIRVKVVLTAIFFKKEQVLWHRLIVRPDPSAKKNIYKNVRLCITTGSDNNSSDSTEIKQVDGLPEKVRRENNVIAGLDMTDGVKFDVLFADTIKHSVKVVAYASK